MQKKIKKFEIKMEDMFKLMQPIKDGTSGWMCFIDPSGELIIHCIKKKHKLNIYVMV